VVAIMACLLPIMWSTGRDRHAAHRGTYDRSHGVIDCTYATGDPRPLRPHQGLAVALARASTGFTPIRGRHTMMSRRRCSATALITLQAAAVAFALISTPLRRAAQQGPCNPGTPEVTVTPGFFTGRELNSLTDDQLGMYAAGYVDALQTATAIGVAEQCRRALLACVIGQRAGGLRGRDPEVPASASKLVG